MTLDLLNLAILIFAALFASFFAAITGVGVTVILLPVLVVHLGIVAAMPIVTPALFAFIAASVAPAAVDGLGQGLALAGAINFVIFGGILWLLFRSRDTLGRDVSWPSRVLDAIAKRGGKPLAHLRAGLRAGSVWRWQGGRVGDLSGGRFSSSSGRR